MWPANYHLLLKCSLEILLQIQRLCLRGYGQSSVDLHLVLFSIIASVLTLPSPLLSVLSKLHRICLMTNILEVEGGKYDQQSLMNIRDGCVTCLWFISSVISKDLFTIKTIPKMMKENGRRMVWGLAKTFAPKNDSAWQNVSRLHVSRIINFNCVDLKHVKLYILRDNQCF